MNNYLVLRGEVLTDGRSHQGGPGIVKSELITASGGCNAELTRNCFDPIDVEAILRQPMGRDAQDFWA